MSEEQNYIYENIIIRKEKELDDILKFINFEITKASRIIGFIGVFLIFLYEKSFLCPCSMIIVTIFLITSLIFCLITITSNKLKVHMNFDKYFEKNVVKDSYFKNKYKTLMKNYYDANSYLEEKELYMRLSMIFFFLGLIVYVILYFIYYILC